MTGPPLAYRHHPVRPGRHADRLDRADPRLAPPCHPGGARREPVRRRAAPGHRGAAADADADARRDAGGRARHRLPRVQPPHARRAAAPYDGLLQLVHAACARRAPTLGVVTSKSLPVVEMAFARLDFAPAARRRRDRRIRPSTTSPAPSRILEALRRLDRRRVRGLLRRQTRRSTCRPHTRRASLPSRVSWGAFTERRAARRGPGRDRPHA